MPLKKGDRVTVGISPTVQIAPYTYVKPSASITRDIVSDDPEAELAQILSDLKPIIHRSILTELDLSSDLHAAVAEGSDGLAQFCMKELHVVPPVKAAKAVSLPTAPGKGDPASQDRPAAKGGPVRRPAGPVRKSG